MIASFSGKDSVVHGLDFVQEDYLTLLVYQNHVTLVKLIKSLHISHTRFVPIDSFAICNYSRIARWHTCCINLDKNLILTVKNTLALQCYTAKDI